MCVNLPLTKRIKAASGNFYRPVKCRNSHFITPFLVNLSLHYVRFRSNRLVLLPGSCENESLRRMRGLGP